MADKLSADKYLVNRESDTDFAYVNAVELGEIIKRRRRDLDLTQNELIRAVNGLGGKLSQGQLSAIENGEVENSASLIWLAQALALDPIALRKGVMQTTGPGQMPNADTNDTRNASIVASEAQFLRQTDTRKGRRTKKDFPVWASAEGGQGAWVVQDHPLQWIETPANLVDVSGGFAVRLMGSSASPRYEHDDILLINPARLVQPGDWCLFLKEMRDGEKLAAVKRLVRRTTKNWLVEQLNPAKQIELPRDEWQKAFKVVGTLTDR